MRSGAVLIAITALLAQAIAKDPQPATYEPVPEAPKYEAPPEAPKYEAPPEAPKYEAPPEAPKYEAPPEAPKHESKQSTDQKSYGSGKVERYGHAAAKADGYASGQGQCDRDAIKKLVEQLIQQSRSCGPELSGQLETFFGVSVQQHQQGGYSGGESSQHQHSGHEQSSSKQSYGDKTETSQEGYDSNTEQPGGYEAPKGGYGGEEKKGDAKAGGY